MVCFDTTFLIDLLRGKNGLDLLSKEFDYGSESISIASPSIIEIIRGLKLGNIDEDENEKVSELISSINVLNLDKDSAILAGKIEASLIKKGEIIDLEDIMIGAIAIINDETLITQNIKHFSKIKNLKIRSY